MLKNILIEAAIDRGFTLISGHDTSSFFSLKNGNAERYLVIKELNLLNNIEDIHEEVLYTLPEDLMQEPAFDKNCDLILFYRFTHFAEYRSLEQKILSYEEDPYHFKKYFLYYVAAEELFLENKGYKDCVNILPDTDAFAAYKTDPFRPSFYSISARIFIKLPFLKLPSVFKELIPLEREADQLVAEANLSALDCSVASSIEIGNDSDLLDEFIERLLNEELENLQAKD